MKVLRQKGVFSLCDRVEHDEKATLTHLWSHTLEARKPITPQDEEEWCIHDSARPMLPRLVQAMWDIIEVQGT